jgi:hypothetical protein
MPRSKQASHRSRLGPTHLELRCDVSALWQPDPALCGTVTIPIDFACSWSIPNTFLVVIMTGRLCLGPPVSLPSAVDTENTEKQPGPVPCSLSLYIHTHTHTGTLTPCGRILRNLIVAPLVKFSVFYWAWRFITVFTRARHWTLSWASWIHLTPCFFKIRFNIIVSYTHIFPKGCLSFYRINCLHAFLISPICVTYCAYFICFDLITLIIFGEEYKLWRIDYLSSVEVLV